MLLARSHGIYDVKAVEMGPDVEPFKIEVPQPMMDDLSERLKGARWPDDLGEGWALYPRKIVMLNGFEVAGLKRRRCLATIKWKKGNG